MADDDEWLAALLDNELGEDEKSALLQRLANDESLRQRLDAVRRDRDRLVASFDALLGQAPLERRRAAIPPAEAEPPTPPTRGVGWLELAAGVATGLLLAGLASLVGFGEGSREEHESWRQAVIEYMDLYTPETFALANPDSAVQAKQLQAVTAKVGVDLTPDKIALPGLRYRTAFNLSYDTNPLGEIAYTDAGGSPVLFCVIANSEPNSPPKTLSREGLSYVFWSRGGRSFMFVGHIPELQAAKFAQILVARF